MIGDFFVVQKTLSEARRSLQIVFVKIWQEKPLNTLYGLL